MTHEELQAAKKLAEKRLAAVDQSNPRWPWEKESILIYGSLLYLINELDKRELREADAERRGWQLAHDKRECGHPRACWQDRNWPESEKNYDPETRTSDPPMEYHCLMCDLEATIAATASGGKGI